MTTKLRISRSISWGLMVSLCGRFETGFEQWTPTAWPALDAPQDEIIEDPTAVPPSCYSVMEVAPPPIEIDKGALLASSSPPGEHEASVGEGSPVGSGTFPLRVSSNTRLTPEGYDRTVNHVCLGVYEDIDGRSHHDLSYHLGDALAV